MIYRNAVLFFLHGLFLSSPTFSWQIVSRDWPIGHVLDGFSSEWEYFTVHDKDGQFTGSIGYFAGDPRGRFSSPILSKGVFPSGNSMAIAGMFKGGEKHAEFVNFGLTGFLDGDSPEFDAAQDQGDQFARLTKLPDDQLALTGKTKNFAWDLTVKQAYVQRGHFERLSSRDIGNFFGEHWTVDILWPRTEITGTMTNRNSGETFQIEGHGYRENAFGQWVFLNDGWDFGAFSGKGVRWVWQSYHTSQDLDALDVCFQTEQGFQKLRFNGADDELGWQHEKWVYDQETKQCLPVETRVVGENESYRIETIMSYEDAYVPMLDAKSLVTKLYFIQIRMPIYRGVIFDKNTGDTLKRFSGRGGGEFSYNRKLHGRAISRQKCADWGKKFSLNTFLVQ